MKRFSLLLAIGVLLQPVPASAQRLGDGRFLRRVFGVEQTATPQESERQRFEKQRLETLRLETLRLETLRLETLRKEAPRGQAPRGQAPHGQAPPQKPVSGQAATQRRANQRSTPPPKPTPAQRAKWQLYSRPSPRQPPIAPHRRLPPSRTAEPSPDVRADQAGHKPRPPSNAGRSFVQNGFGVTLRQNGKQVVVAKTDKLGTAAKAGIKRGDIVASIGSLPIRAPDDAKQFEEVLKPGDQVEFEITRRGKELKLLVPYLRESDPESLADGSEPNDDDANTLLPSPAGPSLTSPAGDRGRESEPRTSRFEPSRPIQPVEGRAKIEKLQEVVQLQKQIIDALQNRLKALEQNNSESGPWLDFSR